MAEVSRTKSIDRTGVPNRGRLLERDKNSKAHFITFKACKSINTLRPPTSTHQTYPVFPPMALRHPWYSQPLKRKHPDDLVPEGGGGYGIGGGGGFGVVGTVCGGLGANAYGVGQTLPPNQGPDSNGRATKRLRNFESRNLERGFAELSIQPAHSVSSPSNFQQQPVLQLGGDGVWSDVVGDAGPSSSVVWSDGSTLPLLRSSSVYEPPSPEVDDVQMSTPTWYEPEKDSKLSPHPRVILLLCALPHSSRSRRILMMFGIARDNNHKSRRRRIRRR